MVKLKTTVCLLLAGVFPLLSAMAQTISVWTGSGDGRDWFDNNNWNNGTPGVNDSAVINAGADVALSAPTADLASFEMTGGTLTFTNWTTCLTAGNVMISGGTVTLSPAFTNNVMSNRVWLVCENFTLGSGALIDTDEKGYARGNGPGQGANGFISGGAGHGGWGGRGNQAPGLPYGSLSEPLYPGSGGGSFSSTQMGTHGGGAVLIESAGTVIVDGIISANSATSGTRVGAGSGGSIYIVCDSFGGSGVVRADGGDASGGEIGGGGGGGRIAVHYNSLLGSPSVLFSANGGVTSKILVDANIPEEPCAPQVGTLYFTDTRLLDSVLAEAGGSSEGINGCIHFGSTNLWQPDINLTGNSRLAVPEGCRWELSDDLTIGVGGRITVNGNASLVCAGGITLEPDAELVVYGGLVEDASDPDDFGALVETGGALEILPGGWIYPFSHSTNGGSALFRVGGLSVAADGGINADGRGYARGQGPGQGVSGYNGGGGGYGGRGGSGERYGAGESYGSLSMPVEPGSGGGVYNGAGGHGGGSVRVESSGAVVIDGIVTVNGSPGNTHAGGGSGGVVNIVCDSFGGNGIVRADGGNGYSGYSGGGGGGRVAVHYTEIEESASVKFSAGHSEISSYLIDRSVPEDILAPRAGTLYFSDTALIDSVLAVSDGIADGINGRIYFESAADWVPDVREIRDSNLILPEGETWEISGDLTIAAGSRMELHGNSALICAGGITLEADGELVVYGGLVEDASDPDDFGALVETGGALEILSGGWIYPFSHSTNGGSALFRVGSLFVHSGGGIYAEGCGYAEGYGPGTGVGGYNAGGAGYGGAGGSGERYGPGPAYGSALFPVEPGSGGGAYQDGRGHGGGVVRILSTGAVVVDGVLNVSGRNVATRAGAGSGGAIYIDCRSFSGSGVLNAYGGNASGTTTGGGGGGGRIAVYHGDRYTEQTPPELVVVSDAAPASFTGTTTVTGGAGYESGEEGTVRWIEVLFPPGTLFHFK